MLSVASPRNDVPISSPSATTSLNIDGVHHFIGFGLVKPHSKGLLNVGPNGFTFTEGIYSEHLPLTSVDDFELDTESRALIPETAATLLRLAPFGSGLAADMIRTGTSVLTIRSHDSLGAVHEAVFFLPKDREKALQSAFADLNLKQEATSTANGEGFIKAKNLLPQHGPNIAKNRAAVQVMGLSPDQTPFLPAYLRAVLYEDLVARLTSSKYFTHVLRTDESHESTPKEDLMTMRINVRAFAKGKPRMRSVAGSAGRTRVNAEVQLVDGSGTMLRDNVLTSAAIGNMEDDEAFTFLAAQAVKLVTRNRP